MNFLGRCAADKGKRDEARIILRAVGGFDGVHVGEVAAIAGFAHGDAPRRFVGAAEFELSGFVHPVGRVIDEHRLPFDRKPETALLRAAADGFFRCLAGHGVSLSRLVWVASADATLAFAENGGVQTESKIGEIFWSFLARDGKPENLRSVLLGVRRGEVTPKQGPRLRPEIRCVRDRYPKGGDAPLLRGVAPGARLEPGP